MEQPKKRSVIKRVLLILASLVVVAVIAVGTTTLLAHNFPKKTDGPAAVTLTPKQQAAKQAAEELSAGKKSEDMGETAAAIASYKEALKNYQAAGDKAGEQGVQLKLQYLESLGK